MRIFLLILIIFIFPISGFSAWFKLFSISTGDLYIDTNSIKRIESKIFFSQLVNYKIKQPNGMMSLKVSSEINCNNLGIKELSFEAYSKKMGLGKKLIEKKAKKSWQYPKKGSSPYFVNQILCDRVD